MAEIIDLGIVGIKNCGEFDEETNYEKLNVVTYQGSSYCALRDTVGNLPTDTDYWQLYAEKGDTGDTGSQGPQGPQGPQGIQGAPGGKPLVASSVDDMTDTDSVYVNITDGKWYYYDGDSWEIGGTYQSTGLADNSVTLNILGEDVLFNLNSRINDKDTINFQKEFSFNLVNNNEIGNINPNTGEKTSSTSYHRTKNFIYLPPSTEIKAFNGNTQVTNAKIHFVLYDKNFNYIRFYWDNAQIVYGKGCYLGISVSNDLDINDITFKLSKINDIEYVSDNLLNKNVYRIGYIGASSGSIYNGTTYKTSTFMKLEANTNYIINSAYRVLCYDKDFIPIIDSYESSSVTNYIVNLNDGGYLVITYLISNEDNVMVVKGDTVPSTYVPYQLHLPENVKVKPDNLGFDIEEIKKSNVLYNKKYVACGDSYTHGDFNHSLTNNYIFTEGPYIGEYKVYPFFIGNRNNMVVINEAVNGSTMTNLGTRSDAFSITRYTQIPADADYITLKFGINDKANNAPIGTIDDEVNTTFYGAWNIVMNYLIRNHPQAKIGIIVGNGDLVGYETALVNIARKWGVSYLNEAQDDKVPLLSRQFKPYVDSDIQTFRNNYWFVNPEAGANANWHPNEKCHEYESTIVENFLRSL